MGQVGRGPVLEFYQVPWCLCADGVTCLRGGGGRLSRILPGAFVGVVVGARPPGGAGGSDLLRSASNSKRKLAPVCWDPWPPPGGPRGAHGPSIDF